MYTSTSKKMTKIVAKKKIQKKREKKRTLGKENNDGDFQVK